MRGLKKLLRQRAAGALLVSLPGGKTWRHPLFESEITVGREKDNDLVLNDRSVSRRHARLRRQGNRLWVEDLGSKNGTYIDGTRQEPGRPVVLPPRAQLSFGEVAVRWRPGTSPTLLVAGLAGAVLVGALLLCAAVAGLAGLLRAEQKPVLGACDQPPLPILAKGGQTFPAGLLPGELPTEAAATPSEVAGLPATPAAEGTEAGAATATAGPTQPPSRPIVSLAFMELPFPYDGGNQNYGGTLAQFRQASQRSGNGGRINSFFDHMLPLYPASNDPNIPGGQEPAQEPVGGNILLYTGQLSPYDNYSGHPALDFSTFVHRQPTTPVFAAADGVITAVGEHTSSGALFVRLKHSVPGSGDFQTTYWHLEPDSFFEAMLGREGQPVTAGTRLGTMGNTGWSTGHHLHFEVRFDRNRDGFFSGGEVVDPYGFIPSVDYPGDPWQERSGLDSLYLWVHPLGVSASVAESGGGQVDTGGTGGAGLEADASEISLCAPPGSLPPGGSVQISWAPDPPAQPDRAGAGRACALSVLDENGVPVDSFDPPVEVAIPFTLADIAGLDPDSLAIHWLAPGREDWQPLPTQFDFERGIALARSDRPGQCALLGDPLGDRIPPVTHIALDGDSHEGAWYGTVVVTLEGVDESGIARTEYSLDGGTTWQLYNGPFELQPGPVPVPAGQMDEEFFAGGAGTHLVLASSTDNAGNVEDPPAYLQFSIDPSKKPESATPSPSPSPSPSPTATETATVSPEGCAPRLIVLENAFCRAGPGSLYDTLTGFQPGAELEINGRNQDGLNRWWRVRIPNSVASCWISDVLVEASEGAACVQAYPNPPTPSPSPTPRLTPTKPSNIYP